MANEAKKFDRAIAQALAADKLAKEQAAEKNASRETLQRKKTTAVPAIAKLLRNTAIDLADTIRSNNIEFIPSGNIYTQDDGFVRDYKHKGLLGRKCVAFERPGIVYNIIPALVLASYFYHYTYVEGPTMYSDGASVVCKGTENKYGVAMSVDGNLYEIKGMKLSDIEDPYTRHLPAHGSYNINSNVFVSQGAISDELLVPINRVTGTPELAGEPYLNIWQQQLVNVAGALALHKAPTPLKIEL